MATQNPFYIKPANPLQALMVGQEAYDASSKRAQESALRDAIAAAGPDIAAGNYQAAVGKLAPSGNLQAIFAAARMQQDAASARRSDAALAETMRSNRANEAIAAQKANEPRVVGSAETGYFLVGRDGKPLGPNAPQAQAGAPAVPGAAPSGPQPIIPAKAKAPKEMTAGDRKAIQESEDEVVELDQTIKALQRARELNPSVYAGWGASAMGEAGTSGIPGANLIFDEKKSKATVEWNQIMNQKAIEQMASTLKGASTDFEMRKFLSIAADTSKPVDVREKAIDRFLALAEEEKKSRTGRFNQLREGTYYQPGGGLSSGRGGQTTAPASGALDEARKAIQAGAPRDAVIKRLRDNGIDPSGL